MAMKMCSGSEAFLILRNALPSRDHDETFSLSLYLSRFCFLLVLLVVLSREHSFSHGDVEQSVSRDTVENKDRVHRVRNAIGRDAAS